MKIKSLTIKNFRGYQNEALISFDNLTVLVGKNDIGKSTILEALDIFFNEAKAIHKFDKDDINKICKEEGDVETVIGVEFCDLPDHIVIDESPQTSLADEYLLNTNGCLEVIKRFKVGSTKPTINIKAKHPNNPVCKDLLTQKIEKLKSKVDEHGISCENLAQKVLLRKAIWNHFADDLQLTEREIPTSGDDMKNIWDKLQTYMPTYSLFQSDRNNSDKDKEAQDPLKEAVKRIMRDPIIQDNLKEVAKKVNETLKAITESTLDKVREMNPEIANSLNPSLPSAEDLGWTDVFKNVSITSDNDIPINKRGSGVKRLILINFFRAEAERVQSERNCPNIIYAIEEPETSQHIEHQKKLIKALKSLSNNPIAQVILTTHSTSVVKQLDFDNIRLVKDESGNKRIEKIESSMLPFPSLNEINYSAYGEVSEEYHNELYGYLQATAINEDVENEKEKYFDQWLSARGCAMSKQWKRVIAGVEKPGQAVTLPTYIRNFYHHPENDKNTKYTYEELAESIRKLREIFSTLYP